MPITEPILAYLHCSPECDFEALVTRYPEFSWNGLHSEVSRLSRRGLMKITSGVGTVAGHYVPALSQATEASGT
jgi:hypothetical protein